MSLKEKLTADMKDAMKAKEAGKQRLSVIRLVRGAVRQLEIDGKKELGDEEVLGVISKEVKQRRDSIEDFKKGGRDDLVAEAGMFRVHPDFIPAASAEGAGAGDAPVSVVINPNWL